MLIKCNKLSQKLVIKAYLFSRNVMRSEPSFLYAVVRVRCPECNPANYLIIGQRYNLVAERKSHKANFRIFEALDKLSGREMQEQITVLRI